MGSRARRRQQVIRGFRADRLRELRRAAGLRHSDLARMVDVGKNTPGNWERGHSTPEVERLPLLAEALGVAISELVYVPDDELMPSDLRVRLGIGAVRLAQQVGISTTVLADFERATNKWNSEYAQRIAPVLGVSFEELREAWQRARTRPPGAPA